MPSQCLAQERCLMEGGHRHPTLLLGAEVGGTSPSTQTQELLWRHVTGGLSVSQECFLLAD